MTKRWCLLLLALLILVPVATTTKEEITAATYSENSLDCSPFVSGEGGQIVKWSMKLPGYQPNVAHCKKESDVWKCTSDFPHYGIYVSGLESNRRNESKDGSVKLYWTQREYVKPSVIRCDLFDSRSQRLPVSADSGHVWNIQTHGWTTNPSNGKLYKEFPGNQGSFNNAKKLCENYDAELVAPRNAEENEFLANLAANKPVWLGITDADVEGLWTYLNGEPVTWSNWAIGKPNGGSWADLGHTTYGNKWDDFGAHYDEETINDWIYSTVCEREDPQSVSTLLMMIHEVENKHQQKMDELEQEMSQVKQEVEELRNKADTAILFFAAQTRPRYIPLNQSFDYNKVFSNVGGAYNEATGEFVCNKDGYYQFAISGLSNIHIKSDFVINLEVNSIPVLSIYLKRPGNTGASSSGIVKLIKGDVARVAPNNAAAHTWNRYDRIYTTFSGQLVSLTVPPATVPPPRPVCGRHGCKLVG